MALGENPRPASTLFEYIYLRLYLKKRGKRTSPSALKIVKGQAEVLSQTLMKAV